MFPRVLNTLLISTPQCKLGRSERYERKHKINESDERNARTWIRILSYRNRRGDEIDAFAILLRLNIYWNT